MSYLARTRAGHRWRTFSYDIQRPNDQLCSFLVLFKGNQVFYHFSSKPRWDLLDFGKKQVARLSRKLAWAIYRKLSLEVCPLLRKRHIHLLSKEARRLNSVGGQFAIRLWSNKHPCCKCGERFHLPIYLSLRIIESTDLSAALNHPGTTCMVSVVHVFEASGFRWDHVCASFYKSGQIGFHDTPRTVSCEVNGPHKAVTNTSYWFNKLDGRVAEEYAFGIGVFIEVPIGLVQMMSRYFSRNILTNTTS